MRFDNFQKVVKSWVNMGQYEIWQLSKSCQIWS